MGDRIVTPPNVPVERILYHRSMHDTNLHTEQTSNRFKLTSSTINCAKKFHNKL